MHWSVNLEEECELEIQNFTSAGGLRVAALPSQLLEKCKVGVFSCSLTFVLYTAAGTVCDLFQWMLLSIMLFAYINQAWPFLLLYLQQGI